jgi:hypothetical protein
MVAKVRCQLVWLSLNHKGRDAVPKKGTDQFPAKEENWYEIVICGQYFEATGLC